MLEEPQERTYQHQVSADLVVEAITTETWSAAQTKKFNENGIYRLNKEELKQKFPNYKSYWLAEGEISTVLYKIEVEETVLFMDNNNTLPDVFIIESSLAGISIENCQWIREDSKFSGNTNFIIDNSTTGNFRIWENSTTGYFSIRENSTTGYFSIRENSTTGNFRIWENSTTGYFDINNSKTGYFDINNSKTGYFWIWENSTTGNFDINNSTTGYFDINNSTTGYFLMENSKSPLWKIEGVQADFYFSKAKIGQCQLNNCDISSLTLKNESAMELYVSGGTVNLIDFEQLSLGKSTILSFSKIALYACNMNEFSALGNLYFRGISRATQPYTFLDIEKHLGDEPDDEHLKLHYQKKKKLLEGQKEQYEKDLKEWQNRLEIEQSTFRIAQSSLGKTEFTECDWGAFKFEYNNSKINEVFISGGTLPNDVEIYEETDKVKINDQRKAFFNQLKKIFDNQGDIVRSVFYRAKAAEIQFDILDSNEKRSPEWWVYFLNKYSNNYGQSWTKALKFIFKYTLPIYLLYIISSGALCFKGCEWDWNFEAAGYYFSFLIPTHKLDYMEGLGASNNALSMALDFAGRIIVGYGIYQLISAFRKHGKRG